MKKILIATVAVVSAINVYANPWFENTSAMSEQFNAAAQSLKAAYYMDVPLAEKACKETLLEEYGHLSSPEKAEMLAGLMCSASSDKNLVKLLEKAAMKVE
ncbi:hypothetical protein [Spartinivicinus poritis]|uniref:Uncharacterized protein n=1 Tax=Spartinivicinus poritis TaxID=2994640 RepID=A0ABT5U4G9_9GAMM|nr:hypothetical protein [Spartinivicinus sp. A2-2]MDE1461115.1 hypothetical protein [Spartinivicinus sp. A2-2]